MPKVPRIRMHALPSNSGSSRSPFQLAHSVQGALPADRAQGRRRLPEPGRLTPIWPLWLLPECKTGIHCLPSRRIVRTAQTIYFLLQGM